MNINSFYTNIGRNTLSTKMIRLRSVSTMSSASLRALRLPSAQYSTILQRFRTGMLRGAETKYSCSCPTNVDALTVGLSVTRSCFIILTLTWLSHYNKKFSKNFKGIVQWKSSVFCVSAICVKSIIQSSDT